MRIDALDNVVALRLDHPIVYAYRYLTVWINPPVPVGSLLVSRQVDRMRHKGYAQFTKHNPHLLGAGRQIKMKEVEPLPVGDLSRGDERVVKLHRSGYASVGSR